MKPTKNDTGKESKNAKLGRGCLITVVTLVLIFVILNQFVSVDRRSPDSMAYAVIRNAFHASQAYFVDNPEGSVTIEIIKSYGVVTHEGVILSLGETHADNLTMTSWHIEGLKTYQVDEQGDIKESYRSPLLGPIKDYLPKWFPLLFY